MRNFSMQEMVFELLGRKTRERKQWTALTAERWQYNCSI
jgi:hypothetical protein